jgi:DNA polymerase-3 subunit chi
MTRIGFYHLQTTSLEQALPQLLEKGLSAGHRILVMAGSKERVEHLDAHLWTYDPNSFLPHGTVRDGTEEAQPVFITASDENPNGADLLVLTDGVQTQQLHSFVRCLNLFDGQDEAAVAAARSAWKEWSVLGHELTYFQQTDRGGWREKARSPDPKKGEQDAEG